MADKGGQVMRVKKKLKRQGAFEELATVEVLTNDDLSQVIGGAATTGQATSTPISVSASPPPSPPTNNGPEPPGPWLGSSGPTSYA